MWGAIIGDIAGSIYEYNQLTEVKEIKIKEIIPENGFFSDDTILTVAIADAIQHGENYKEFLKLYGKKYQNYKPNCERYFKTSFSPGFIKWVNGDKEGNSTGNGALMRISPVGFMFDNENDVIRNAQLATIPSHNSDEAIKHSILVALIIFYSRNGMHKEEIKNRLRLEFDYVPFKKFNTTCEETFNNCIYALFTSNSFEESIKKIISYGGDTDTNACIVGSMAEAMYGIDNDLIEKAKTKIPSEFTSIIDNMYKKKLIENDFER